jgi:hypothetical protein
MKKNGCTVGTTISISTTNCTINSDKYVVQDAKLECANTRVTTYKI